MIYFISDLHLCPSRPETTTAFLSFLCGAARTAEVLWILGDLFEYWAGDDELAEDFNAHIANALKALSDAGVKIRLIVGNRDFLLGEGFSLRSGVEIVTEPHRITLGEQPCVLLHGDALCTDDTAYQQFRGMVRNPAWQAQFLSQPLGIRQKIAADIRAKSEASKQEKMLDIMDVNAAAVAQAFRDTNASLMIHGHTHRPAAHTSNVDARTRQRFVLPDWHGKACGLRWDGQYLETFGQD